eukprot:Tbor_TRINITY_DN5369_c3_g2::TRINITY_DN5369_c3_g2_i24::g.3966::m.3966
MSEEEQLEEIRRILSLPPKADPFTILGIDIFNTLENNNNNINNNNNNNIKSDSNNTEEQTQSSINTSNNNNNNNNKQRYTLKPNIDFSLVKKIYRKKVLLIHPDKCNNNKADNAFQIIDKAMKILNNEPSTERFKLVLLQKKNRELELAERKNNNLN